MWMSHAPRIHESRFTYEWVISIIRKHSSHWSSLSTSSSYVHICEWVMPHVHTNQVWHVNESILFSEHTPATCRHYHHRPPMYIYVNESCPTREWVMSHKWTSHVPCMNESFLLSENTPATGCHYHPQTEEIRLEIITIADISTSFHGSTRNFQTRFHGSLKNSQ